MKLQADILVGEVEAEVEPGVIEPIQVGVPALVTLPVRQVVWVSSNGWPMGPAGLYAAKLELEQLRQIMVVHWPEVVHEVDWSVLFTEPAHRGIMGEL